MKVAMSQIPPAATPLASTVAARRLRIVERAGESGGRVVIRTS
jgi:hypothetical protein